MNEGKITQLEYITILLRRYEDSGTFARPNDSASDAAKRNQKIKSVSFNPSAVNIPQLIESLQTIVDEYNKGNINIQQAGVDFAKLKGDLQKIFHGTRVIPAKLVEKLKITAPPPKEWFAPKRKRWYRETYKIVGNNLIVKLEDITKEKTS